MGQATMEQALWVPHCGYTMPGAQWKRIPPDEICAKKSHIVTYHMNALCKDACLFAVSQGD